MLAEHCLLADTCEGAVLLTVTPGTLVAALDEAGERGTSAEDAEADFISAVSAVYRNRVVANPRTLHALIGVSPHDVPYGIGFLALSVLAAFHMHSDDERTGRAFYPRLAEMLDCNLVRSYPVGFEGDAFIKLWEELASWLKANYRRKLSAPAALGTRRYLAYPFAHMPLRQVDIERLPRFFEAYAYEPGSRPPLDRLTSDLCGDSGPWRYLTSSGRSALDDPSRKLFVIRQVAQELERWDGCRIDSSGAKTGLIQLWMEIRNRRARLHMLARRPNGFPELVDDAVLVFSSSQEGWYEPVPIGPEDGAILDAGLSVVARSAAGRYCLQLRQANVMVLTPSDQYTGFVSDRALRLETQCAVLCSESIADDVGRFLETVTRKKPAIRRDDTLPKGWCLFTEVCATDEKAPPAGLENLRVDSSLALVAEGGLRLGRRWTWLEGAAARLTVIGAHKDLDATIDGQLVPLDEVGRLQTDVLGTAGLHVVEIGNRLRRKVNVLPGTVHPDCSSWLEGSEANVFPIAIPGGHWMIVGSEPGECTSINAPSAGVLVRATFPVRWAVRLAPGAGTIALHIHDRRFDYAGTESKRRLQAAKNARTTWTEAISQANSRRPQFLCQNGCTKSHMSEDWRALAESAHSLQRRKRRRG